MWEPQPCFKCGQLGHLKANCPQRRTPTEQPPPAPPADAGSAVNRIQFVTDPEGVKRLSVDIPGDHRGPAADAHQWANRIREHDPRLGAVHCGEPADLIRTEFRRISGYGAQHECRLRVMAARQAEEARQGRAAA